MELELWNNQYWMRKTPLPRGTKLYLLFVFISSLLLTFIIFFVQYPIYQTFYGIVKKNGNNIVEVMVPVEQLEQFESAVIQNKKISLKQVSQGIQFVMNQNVVVVDLEISISKKLLVQNNIIPIRLKIKNMSLWKEFSQKWKKGMKNEKIKE